MTTGPVEEQVSSWLDDELPAAELELLAGRMTRSEQCRNTAARYALIGEIMRGAGTESVHTLELHERVRRALDDAAATGERPADFPAGQTRRFWWGAAAAAALAVVTAGLLNFPGSFSWQPQSGIPAGDVLVRRSAPEALPVEILPGMTTVPASAGAAGQGSVQIPPRRSLSPDRLTNYLVYHGEYSGLMSTKVVDSHIVNQRPYVITVNTVERMSHD